MACILCGNANALIIRKSLRYRIRRYVMRCCNCGLIFLKPRKHDLKRYYSDGEYRKRHSAVLGKRLSPKENYNIFIPFQKGRINRIRQILKPRMKVLEIGCSSGYFLSALKKYVSECIGIELNKDDARFVNDVFKIRTYTEPLEKTGLPLRYFDLICSFQVLEHLENPLRFLRIIKRYLKSNGYLYLELPNVWDALISLYKVEEYSKFMFLEPHLYYFSPKTLSLLLGKAGFSGRIFSEQSYNLLNQINWILSGKPQQSASIGMSGAVLLHTYDKEYKKAALEINRFIGNADKKYKQILQKYSLGDNLVFIGRKNP